MLSLIDVYIITKLVARLLSGKLSWKLSFQLLFKSHGYESLIYWSLEVILYPNKLLRNNSNFYEDISKP